MTGIAAITAHNGWAMAFVGAGIVLSGLAVLSLIISQLHKILALFERAPAVETAAEPEQPAVKPAAQEDLFDTRTAAVVYQPLMDQLRQPFELRELYALAAENGLPHTHWTIKTFRESGLLVPEGEGLFVWKP